jgi:hypothetical protein
VYSAAIEGLSAEERRDFIDDLSETPRPVAGASGPRALPPAPSDHRLDELAQARRDRMTAIAGLGGEVVLEGGA